MAAFSWRRAGARGPGLSRTPSGLLWVCGMELLLFSMVFLLGWLASRVSREALLLRWRPGWWVAPLGIGYSVAIRLAVGLVVLAASAVIVFTRLATPESLQQFLL